MNDNILQTIGRALMDAHKVRLTTHIRPDGDAIGSLLGMGISLAEKGKQVEMVLSEGVPAALRFITGCDMIRRDSQKPFDLLIALDCSDEKRVGTRIPGNTGYVDVNIDHHATNTEFAKFNMVDDQAVATAEILAINLPLWGFPITQSSAEALLTGIVTDSIGFRTNNMTPRALRVAANLMESGADLVGLYYQALVKRSFESLKYWGYGLSRLERTGRLVWTTITASDRAAAAYLGNDDADLINLLSSIDGADVFVLFNEQGNGQVKVSWRSSPNLDVSTVALEFGGGGHPCAAGAEIEGNLDQIQEKVLKTTSRMIAINTPEQTIPS